MKTRAPTAGDAAPAQPRSETVEERIDLRGRSLRQHAARGTIINSGFQLAMAGLGFLRRFVIAAFLTRAEFGIWGILLTTLITLSWLKQIGIGDKYIQQSEPDQEGAYQKAFTLEFALSAAFFVFICAALPIYAVAYGRTEIIVPGIVLALSVPISAFETPQWIAYRRMQFVRERVLVSIDGASTLVLTIVLGMSGLGSWCPVVG